MHCRYGVDFGTKQLLEFLATHLPPGACQPCQSGVGRSWGHGQLWELLLAHLLAAPSSSTRLDSKAG